MYFLVCFDGDHPSSEVSTSLIVHGSILKVHNHKSTLLPYK